MATAAETQECKATDDYRRTMEDLDSMVIEVYRGETITRGQLKTAFDSVANTENWKMPIDAVVYLPTLLSIHTMRQAVIFFTAAVPEFEETSPSWFRVTAPGYYISVGA